MVFSPWSSKCYRLGSSEVDSNTSKRFTWGCIEKGVIHVGVQEINRTGWLWAQFQTDWE